MAFGLGGLVGLSAAGGFGKAYDEFQKRKQELDTGERDALSYAALGNLGKMVGSGPGWAQDPVMTPGAAPPPGGYGAGDKPPQMGPAPGTTGGITSQPLPPPPGQASQPAPGGGPGPMGAPNGPPMPPPPSPQLGPQAGPMPAGMTMGSVAGRFPGPGNNQPAWTGNMMGTAVGAGQGQPPMPPVISNAPSPAQMAQNPMMRSMGPQSPPGPGGMPSGQPPGQPPMGQSREPSLAAPSKPSEEVTNAMQDMIRRGEVPPGGYSWQNMAQMIARANPGIRPDVLGKAILLSAPMLNRDSMMQFREMQMMQREREMGERGRQFDEREKRLKDEFDRRLQQQTSEREAREAYSSSQKELDRGFRQKLADVKNELAGDRLLNQDPEVKGLASSLTQLEKNFHNIEPYSRFASTQGDRLLKLVEKIETTGSPVLERWIRGGRKAILGDPDVTAFDFQLRAFANESARVLNTANLTGQLTNQAKNEMNAFLGEGSTFGQLKAVVDLFRLDAQTRAENMGNEIDTVREQIAKRKELRSGKEQPRTTTPTYTPPSPPGKPPAPAAPADDEFKGFSIGRP